MRRDASIGESTNGGVGYLTLPETFVTNMRPALMPRGVSNIACHARHGTCNKLPHNVYVTSPCCHNVWQASEMSKYCSVSYSHDGCRRVFCLILLEFCGHREKSTSSRYWAICISNRSGPNRRTMSHSPPRKCRAPAWTSSSRSMRE